MTMAKTDDDDTPDSPLYDNAKSPKKAKGAKGTQTAGTVLPEDDEDVKSMREVADFNKAKKAGTLEPIPDEVSQKILKMGRDYAAKRWKAGI